MGANGAAALRSSPPPPSPGLGEGGSLPLLAMGSRFLSRRTPVGTQRGGFGVRPPALPCSSGSGMFAVQPPGPPPLGSEDLCKYAQDLPLCAPADPSPQPDLLWSVAGGGDPVSTARTVPLSRSGTEKCSAQTSLEDPLCPSSLPRILASDRFDGDTVYSPGYHYSHNADGALKPGSPPPPRHAGGSSAAPRLSGQPSPVASNVNDDGWSVVRPRF
jgi:hypothetical protein